jgi:hypothetical protein
MPLCVKTTPLEGSSHQESEIVRQGIFTFAVKRRDPRGAAFLDEKLRQDLSFFSQLLIDRKFLILR